MQNSMRVITFKEAIEQQGGVLETLDYNRFINIRGCNGAGKSTVPLMMRDSDPDATEIMWWLDGNNKPSTLGVLCPKYHTILLGRYRTACGGMDSVKNNAHAIATILAAWGLNYHLICEGVVMGTIFSTYANVFKNANDWCHNTRQVTVFTLLPPVEVCIDRVKLRNGGTAVKNDLIQGKWMTNSRNAEKFRQAGIHSVIGNNANIAREDTLKWFANEMHCPDFAG